MNILVTVIVAVLPILLLAFSWKVRPVWLQESDLQPKWSKILIQSTAISYLVGMIVFFLSRGIEAPNLIISPSNLFVAMSMLVSFPILQSIYTDFKHRLVDRFILWATTGLALIFGTYSLYETAQSSYIMLISYFMLFAIASVILYVPAIGKSDGRAFQLLIATVFPVTIFSGITTSMILFLVAIVIYGIGVSIKEKDFTIMLKKRISMPMVPLILIPALATILFYVAKLAIF